MIFSIVKIISGSTFWENKMKKVYIITKDVVRDVVSEHIDDFDCGVICLTVNINDDDVTDSIEIRCFNPESKLHIPCSAKYMCGDDENVEIITI